MAKVYESESAFHDASTMFGWTPTVVHDVWPSVLVTSTRVTASVPDELSSTRTR